MKSDSGTLWQHVSVLKQKQGTSAGIVSVLFLSSTGQPCACSVCSEDGEVKAEHLGGVSSALSF